MGVGWSFQTARIINDYKGTATTEDDEYYLNLDGSSKKLLITGFNPSNKSYSLITQEYTPYKISYFKEEMIEKWEVLSDDGTVLSFGGVTGLKPDGYNKAGKSNSIEWLVSTGDKIMPTNTVFDGTSRIQSQLAVSWSLESVTDQFGNKTTYTYETSEIPVGQLTGCHYTRFQNLIGIEDNRGNTLEIIYNDKTSDEVIDSHPWSSGNPVYFQDKSNPRFITIFQLKNKDNIILKTVDLTYGFLGTGEKKKRFLTWITEKNPMGEVQPDLVFKYFETAADFNYGKLNKVISPMGQETVFTYQQIQLSSTDLDSPIRYYPPNNGENIVASSNGSCLLTITPDRSNNQIRYQVSECLNGKWDLVSSGNVAGLIEMYNHGDYGNNIYNLEIFSGKNYFAIVYNSKRSRSQKRVVFITRDELTGKWSSNDFYNLNGDQDLVFNSMPETAGTDNYNNSLKVVNGENWLTVIGENSGKTIIFTLINGVWIKFRADNNSGFSYQYGKSNDWIRNYEDVLTTQNGFALYEINQNAIDKIIYFFIYKGGNWSQRVFDAAHNINSETVQYIGHI